jgi:sterol-4alpha-carboxylate 3-dehydrogenase (decarboxylating)
LTGPTSATSPTPISSQPTGQTKIPTSNARPIGPKRPEDVTDEDRRVDEAYHGSGTVTYENDLRPVLRTRFDQFANAIPTPDDLPEDIPPTHLSVAGQAFFITNCEPVYFWDFPRAVWRSLGHTPSSIWQLPRTVGLMLAGAAEGWSWLMGKEPGFTRYRVKYSSSSRYYNVERARRVLGYEPIVGIQEGIDRTVEVSILLSIFFLLSV